MASPSIHRSQLSPIVPDADAPWAQLRYIWRSDFDGLELRLLEDAPGTTSWVVDRHAAVINARAEHWWYRGIWREAPAGTVRLVEPAEVVQHAATQPGIRAVLAFAPESLRSAAEPAATRVLGFRSHLLLGQVDLAAALVRPPDAARPLDIMLAARALAGIIVPGAIRFGAASRVADPPRDGVTIARDHLLANPMRLVSLEELAAVAGLSRFHLARRFTAEVGLPPHAYHLHVRVALARRLLAQGLEISAIAEAAGFADQAHLTRWFTRLFGMSPGRYQRATDSVPLHRTAATA